MEEIAKERRRRLLKVRAEAQEGASCEDGERSKQEFEGNPFPLPAPSLPGLPPPPGKLPFPSSLPLSSTFPIQLPLPKHEQEAFPYRHQDSRSSNVSVSQPSGRPPHHDRNNGNKDKRMYHPYSRQQKQQGHHRAHDRFKSSNSGYFKTSMMEDPWEELLHESEKS